MVLKESGLKDEDFPRLMCTIRLSTSTSKLIMELAEAMVRNPDRYFYDRLNPRSLKKTKSCTEAGLANFWKELKDEYVKKGGKGVFPSQPMS